MCDQSVTGEEKSEGTRWTAAATEAAAKRPEFWRDGFHFTDSSQKDAVRAAVAKDSKSDLSEEQCLDILCEISKSDKHQPIQAFAGMKGAKNSKFNIFGIDGAYFVETTSGVKIGIWSTLDDVRDFLYYRIGYLQKTKGKRTDTNRRRLRLSLEQIDAIRRSKARKLKRELLSRLYEKSLLTADIRSISLDQYGDLYDASVDALQNCNIHVQRYVNELIDEDSFSPYIHILGIPGAYWLNAGESGDRGVWSTLDEAESFVARWFNGYEPEE